MKHEKSCPKCFGTGKDCVGKPCNYVRPVEPVVHTSGIKRWDDATSSTWVDTIPSSDYWMVGLRNVHLSDGWTVRDGDPKIYIPLRWNESEEARRDGALT